MNQRFDDVISKIIKIATDILFIKNPMGTSIGILVGIILHGLIGLFSPILELITVIRITAIKWWHLVCLGVLGLNIKPFINLGKIPPEIESGLRIIKKYELEQKLKPDQVNTLYYRLISRYIESVTLDHQTQNDLNSIENALQSK